MAVPMLPEFNISNVTRPSDYKNLMKNVRPILGVKMSSYQLPVLAPSPPSTPAGDKLIKFFDMVLRADKNEASITLRLRQDNLYLIRFQMGKSGEWWEFDPETGTKDPTKNYLGFTEGYDAMVSASGGGNLQGRRFGRGLLNKAVTDLNASNTSTATRAESLIVVIVMICESLRFTYISDFLADTFTTQNPTKQSNVRMVTLMKNWDKLSQLLLKREQDPTHYFPSNPPPKEMEIHTYLDAVEVLGLLKEIKVASATALLTTTTIVVSDEQQQYPYPLGEPMVEVISVKIDNNICSNVYGTIQVIDGTGSQYIYYKTTPDDVKITKPTEFILLTTTPYRSILAYDSFSINVNLKNGNNTSSSKTPKEDDDVMINGMISWNAFNTTTNVYDQPLHQVIKGEYGSSVTLNYVVLSDAVKAKLEVTLLKLAGDDDGTGTDTTAPVYGDLIARIGNFEEGCVLFKKASEEHICVTPGQPIPLLRSFVAVPLNSSLIVEAHISSPDHDIAKGTAEFPALLSGTSEKTISGKYGKIQVKVTWERET